MGSIMSVFDQCAPQANTPAAYMEQEMLRESRFKKNMKQRKMDIMGEAMESALSDIKHIVGIQSDNEEAAVNDQDYLNMSQLKRKYLKRTNSGQSNYDYQGDNKSQRRVEDAYYDYIEKKKEEARLRQKTKQKMSIQKKGGRKALAPRAKQSALDNSQTNIHRVRNPAGSYNPNGGVLSSRRFGQKGEEKVKGTAKGKGVFQFGGSKHSLLDESSGDIHRLDTFNNEDDNMSVGDVRVIGGASEFGDESQLSIRQYQDSSDGESINILGMQSNDSDTSIVFNNMKRSQSNWDTGSQYTDSSVLMMEDTNSNLGSIISETTIKQADSSRHLQLPSVIRGKSHMQSIGGSSTNIIDDQSQGYGMDSEMDAQEMIQNFEENKSTLFIEGDSETIEHTDRNMYQVREDDEEMENSFEQARKTYGHKKPKSLDDYNGEEEDRIQEVVNDKSLAGDQALKNRKSIREGQPDQSNFLDDSQPEEAKRSPLHTGNQFQRGPKKIDSSLYIKQGEEIREDDENEFNDSDSDDLNFRQVKSYDIFVNNMEEQQDTPKHYNIDEFSDQNNSQSNKSGGNSQQKELHRNQSAQSVSNDGAFGLDSSGASELNAAHETPFDNDSKDNSRDLSRQEKAHEEDSQVSNANEAPVLDNNQETNKDFQNSSDVNVGQVQ